MACLNKTLPAYKTLVKMYGDSLADAFVRGYSQNVKLLGENDFYYPSVKEVTDHLAKTKRNIPDTIAFALKTNPNLSEQAIKGLLKGVAHMYDGDFYITSGRGNSDDTIITDAQLSSIFRPNFNILKDLADRFPEKFNIRNTKERSYVKIFEINAPKGRGSETTGRMPDAQIRSKYFKDSDTQKVSSVLSKIATSSHPLNKLAQKLMEFSEINDVNVVLEKVDYFKDINPDVKKASGYYSPSKNEIRIAELANVQNGLSETLILHEVLHALSSNILNENTQLGRDFKKLYDRAVEKLGGYNPETKENYALLDIDEFFVGIFTNAKFIKRLKSVEPTNSVKYDNLFQEIIDYILDLLKLNKESSLYDEAFAVATNVLDYERDRMRSMPESVEQEYVEYPEDLFNEPIDVIKPGVQELFDSNPKLANSVYEALGFKIFPEKGTKEYRNAENILEIEMMLDDLESENLRGNFKFQDILVKATKLPGFNDKYVGWRKYFNVITDMDTMIGIYGYIKEKEGYTQSDENLQELLKLIKNYINSSRISVITPQQKQQALEQYSAYLDSIFPDSKQDLEGFKKFVSGDRTMLQKKGTELSKASPKTIKMIKDFLTKAGVNYEQVKEIVYKGRKLDANAIANITQRLIQVVNGKEDVALPEEAMHFAVELIQQNDPKLFNQLLKEINNYNTLKEVYADYGNDPLYQTKDGKPDILKLKKEAIGKVLAEVVIGKAQELSETAENVSNVQSWWQKIIDIIKGIFLKSGFDAAAMKIVSGESLGSVEDLREEENNLFLQKSSRDVVYDKLKLIKSQIDKRDDGYYINGKKVPQRVTDIVQDWYSRRFTDNELTKSEYQKAVDDLKAEKGTAGHADLEYIFSLFVDDDGYLRDSPKDDSGYVSKLNPNDRTMYNTLKDNLRTRLNSFPKNDGGTRFLSEAMVYNEQRGLAGTIDFLAITPDGKVNILDWKFMDLNTDKYEDVPWYKVVAWQKQMEQYKLILQNAYGVKNQDFQQTRMIPIKAVYSEANAKTKTLPTLLSVRIGDVEVENITDDYLVPVGLTGEKTGDDEIDELLTKLNALYKKFSDKRVKPEEKIAKAEQLNSLFSAIRQLQMKKNLAPLITQAKILNKRIQNILDEYATGWVGSDPEKMDDATISAFNKELETVENALSEVYSSLDTDLDFLFQGKELSEQDKILREELRNTADTARFLSKKVDKVSTEFTKTFVVGKEGVEGDITLPEKIIKGITRLFSSTSTLQTKALEVFFKKANRVLGFASQDTLSESKKLANLKEPYDAWAKARGLNNKNYFDILKKKDKNELINEFDPNFYKELKQKIADKDFDWIKANIDEQAVRDEIQKKFEEEVARINDKTRAGSPEENKFEMDREIANARALYNTATPTSNGWLVYDTVKKFPNRNKWESQEWKTLTAKGNEPAKAFYDYIIERNKYYQSIKYINAASARVFLPFVRKGLMEKIITGGDIRFGEQFMRTISIDEGDVGFGEIDPFTGQPLNTVPKYFTREIEGELSTDLFRTMALYNESAIKFKYLTDIEGQTEALLRVERNKEAIATSMFGKTVYKDGKIQYTPDNSDNAKLLEDMMKAIVYQQRYIQSESFDQLLGTLGNFGETLNKKLGIKIFPENLSGRQLSVNKIISQLNNTFQINALGLNPLSALSNLLGGTFQSIINAETYFTRLDYEGTALWMMGNKMTQGPDQKKAIGALEYFLPLTDNYNREVAKKLSLSKLSQENVQEFLMVMMRKSDYFVQSNNFYTFLRNTIVDGDRVINVREYLREQPEYKDMYAGTEADRKARRDKFEEDVKKLLEEKAVLKLAEIKDGEFVIPGVDRKSRSVIELRRKVQQLSKDALGNLSEDDLRTINMNIYGKSFMIFKNWIPRPVDVRMGNLKYNAGSDAYEWGRMRMVLRVLSMDVLKSIGRLKNSLYANDKGVEFMRQLYEKKKSDYELDTGKELKMTESEFMDLVRRNIKAQLVDVIFLTTLLALYFGMKANAPEDDEDEIVKNQYKFMLRAADKVTDELLYFYNPASITSLVSSGIFPSMSYLTNFSKLLKNFMIENYAISIGDTELEEKNQVIKYLMKSFPVSNQAAGMLPMFYPELAKDLGIKVQSQARPFQ